jgi:hypothetical protein
MERIQKDQVDIIVVFTDGYSGLSKEIIDKFNQSGKKCYPIYFSHNNYGYRHTRKGYWDDEPNGIDKDGMHSDLDQLNGESFTIWCENM